MINPFISKNESQFLFRKNYQAFQKPNQAAPSPQYSDNTHLHSLQRRNPFTSHSPIISMRPNNFNSPERPVSTTKKFHNLSQSRYFPGKGGILQEADGWRRDLQKKQREKMQIYGAEGLRYNAYLGTPRQRNQNSDYFHLSRKNQEVKSPTSNLKFSLHNSQTENYYFGSSQRAQQQKPKQKRRKEYFEDEIEEQSPKINLVDPRKSQKYQPEDSSRHSKVKDMFESQYDDKFKQSNNYGSFYGMNQVEAELRSQNLYNSSKFRDSKYFHRTNSIQSQVHRLDTIAPDSIKVSGRIYYRINV